MGSVTSLHIERMRACGKSWEREVMWSVVEEKSRSRRARPESPCSRRARALTRARVPPPPVTRGGKQVELVGKFFKLRGRNKRNPLRSYE